MRCLLWALLLCACGGPQVAEFDRAQFAIAQVDSLLQVQTTVWGQIDGEGFALTATWFMADGQEHVQACWQPDGAVREHCRSMPVGEGEPVPSWRPDSRRHEAQEVRWHHGD